MKPQEFILLGCIAFAFMTMVMQIFAAKEKGMLNMKDPHPINIFHYLTKPMPEGTFSVNQPLKYAWAWCGAIIGLIGFGWVMTNVPEWFTLGTVYFGISLIVMVVGLADDIAPNKLDIAAAIGFGYGRWDEQILYGFLMSIPFIMIGTFGTIYYKGLQIEGMPVASFILTVIMIPPVEEGLFRGVIAPSIAEQAGLIHGVLLSAFIFAVFHAYAYHLSLVPILIAFCFGVVAALVDLYFKSIIPSTIAHSLINLVAFMAMV